MCEKAFRDCINYLEQELAAVNLPAGVTKVVRDNIDRATQLLDDGSKPWEAKLGIVEGSVNTAKDALMGVTLGNKLKITTGDITAAPVSGIVNAANTSLKLGGGVAGAIRQKGGPRVQAECDVITGGQKNKVEMGKVAVTSGGNLSQTILHAAVMDWGGQASFESVRRATRNIIVEAKQRGLKSIAIPALGAGAGGLSAQESAAAIRKGLYDMVMDLMDFNEIQIVAYDGATQSAFDQAFGGGTQRSTSPRQKLAA